MRKLPIIYRPMSGEKRASIWLLYLHIGTLSFSETIGSYFINFKNISDEVHECKTKGEVAVTVNEVANKFIDDILEDDKQNPYSQLPC